MTPNQIKHLRQTLNFTQKELADRLNTIDPYLKVAPTTVSRWENGRTPAPHVQGALQMLAKQEGLTIPPIDDHGTADMPTEAEAIQSYRELIAQCDKIIASGDDDGFTVSSAQSMRRLAVATLRIGFGIVVE